MRTSDRVKYRLVIEQVEKIFDELCDCWICREIRLLHSKKEIVADKVNHEK